MTAVMRPFVLAWSVRMTAVMGAGHEGDDPCRQEDAPLLYPSTDRLLSEAERDELVAQIQAFAV